MQDGMRIFELKCSMCHGSIMVLAQSEGVALSKAHWGTHTIHDFGLCHGTIVQDICPRCIPEHGDSCDSCEGKRCKYCSETGKFMR